MSLPWIDSIRCMSAFTMEPIGLPNQLPGDDALDVALASLKNIKLVVEVQSAAFLPSSNRSRYRCRRKTAKNRLSKNLSFKIAGALSIAITYSYCRSEMYVCFWFCLQIILPECISVFYRLWVLIFIGNNVDVVIPQKPKTRSQNE